MDRNIQRNGLINLLALLVAGVAGFAVARYAGSAAGQMVAVFAGFGVLVAFVSWFQMRLEERERLEKLELEEMARSKASATLFEARDAEIFPAQRSREQFQKFFVPGFTALLFIGQAVVAFALWRWLAATDTVLAPEHSMKALAAFALLALGLFLLGRFSATIARLEDNRLLRPGAGYLLLAAYLSAAAAVGIALVTLAREFPNADLYVAKFLCVLLALVALETLLTLVLEIYRPRVKGKVGRPLYESRVVGLLGQPEGLITTAAQALDYQFGFKVSDTWAYRFLEQRLGLLILLQLGVLLVSTSFVVVESGEQALLERFGRRVGGASVLNPGLHFKMPWPVDQVYRYRTDQIQTISVGFAPEEDEHDHTTTIVWTAGHGKEDNFLVANREPGAPQTADGASRKAPPVSLLTVSIPVQFQVTNITDWVYGHENGSNFLQQISTREVVRYLVSADFNEVMSHGRLTAGNALRARIQAAATGAKLGVNVLFVGLQDIHPPVKVAPEYEKVVGAIQQKRATILAAESDAIRTNAMAGARAFTATNAAAAERLRLRLEALARAAAFTNQIPAFAAAPSVYKQRAYLKTLPDAIAGARKYVLLTTNTEHVIQFDLQNKVSEEFFQNLTPPPTPTR